VTVRVRIRLLVTRFLSVSLSCVACCNSDLARSVAIELNLHREVGAG
jgi:hypothetical protein